MSKQEQPYLVFEHADEYRQERWTVVRSKREAIQEILHGADNALPISEEIYLEYKKLEETISTAQWRMWELEKPFHDAMLYDESVLDDPEYREAKEWNDMLREAYRMNWDFDNPRTYHIPEQEEPIAEWEKELLAQSEENDD